MFNLNMIQIIGNMTQDPMTKTTPSSQMYCLFSVATNRSYKTKDGKQIDTTQFHNCIAWRKLAEIIAKLGCKGYLVYVEGEVAYNEFDKDGVKQKKTEIVVHNFILLRGEKEARQESGEVKTEDLAF